MNVVQSMYAKAKGHDVILEEINKLWNVAWKAIWQIYSKNAF